MGGSARMAKERPRFLVPVAGRRCRASAALGRVDRSRSARLPHGAGAAALFSVIRPAGRPDGEPGFPGGPDGRAVTERRSTAARRVPFRVGGGPARNEAFTGRDDMLVGLREGLQALGRSRRAVPSTARVGWVRPELAAELRGGSPAITTRCGGSRPSRPTLIAQQYAASPRRSIWSTRPHRSDAAGGELAAVAGAGGRGRSGAGQRHPPPTPVAGRSPGRATRAVTLRDRGAAADRHQRGVDVFDRTESIPCCRPDLPTSCRPKSRTGREGGGDLLLGLAQAAGHARRQGLDLETYLEPLADPGAGEVLAAGRPLAILAPLAVAIRAAADELARGGPGGVADCCRCAR